MSNPAAGELAQDDGVMLRVGTELVVRVTFEDSSVELRGVVARFVDAGGFRSDELGVELSGPALLIGPKGRTL